MKKSKIQKSKEFEFTNSEDSLKFVKNGIEVVRNSASSIKDLFLVKFSDDTIKMSFGKLLFFVNLSLARIYIRDLVKDDFDEINFSDSASKIVSTFHDKTIGICIKENANVDGVRNLISKTVENMADMAYATNESCGSTINLIDMLELGERNPVVKKILNMKVNENGDYYDTTKKILDNNKKLLSEIKNDPLENAYANLMSSISPGQFQQVFCCVGYKPEVTSSNIFPHCVNTSLLRGFRNEMDYYVSAMGSRKALITNA